MLQEGGFIVEERYSAWQKKKVKTYVVNAHSKSATTKSIATALQHAKPYERIELTGGEYTEAITLSFPIELVASEGEDPVILSRNSAVTITGSIEVYLERLTLTSKGNSRLEAGLAVMGGAPIVFHCKLSSVLLGGATQAHIERCTIADSFSGYGLIAHDQTSGRITGTTIYSHSHACVEVDTRGELTISECHLYNYESVGGDVIVVSSGGGSGSRADSFSAEAPCSRVTVSNCQIYVSKEESLTRRLTEKEGPVGVNNVAGVPCCVVISNGAAPTFASNELIQGVVGFLLDGPGAAQLKGNIIRNQQQSGVLAMVEEGYSMLRGRNSLRIAGDNVIDHCYIGVDVQSNTSRAGVSAATAANGIDKKLSNDLPHAKRASHWLGNDLGVSMKANRSHLSERLAENSANDGSTADPCLKQQVLVNDEYVSLRTLLERIRYLTKNSLQAYPACMQNNFNTVSAAPPLMPMADSSPNTSTALPPAASSSGNAFVDLARQLLNVTTSASDRDASRLAMMELFGNQGVDVVNTKFFSCDMCAIRFGRQGYGVVEDCIFENCGTHGVIVDSGAHPIITGCHFLRSRGAGILVGNFGNPLIIGNEITGGQVDGIELTSLSRGVIVGNLISVNHGVGVKVDGSSYPIIAGNAFCQNRGGGLGVFAGSRPTVLRNTFFGNLASQIRCDDYADALIAYNQVQSTADAGIRLSGCARSTLLKNDISTNGDGIVVELDADPIVRHNYVRDNLRVGILCQDNGMGTFTHNTVSANGGPNVLLKEGASSVFRDNGIERGAQGGVVVVLEGSGWFERNRIGGNSVANVLVCDAFTNPTFSHNAIYGSLSGCGVICATDSKPLFEFNEIYENSQAGVYVLRGGQGLFTDNLVSREAVGVLVAEHGRGHFVRNRVEGCYGTGVLTQTGGDPQLECNKISGCQLSGVQISPDGAGTLTDNDIYENDVGVQVGSSLVASRLDISSVYLAQCAGSEASSAGLGAGRSSSVSPFVHPFTNRKSVLMGFASNAEDRKASAARSSACRVLKNDIHHNKNGGILVEAQPHGQVEENQVHDNGDYGVRGDVEYSTDRAQRIMEANVSVSVATRTTPVTTADAPGGAQQVSTGSITLRRNKIYRHAEANVYVVNLRAYEVYLDENDVSVAPMGIYITQNSRIPRVSKNDIHHCLEGVFLDAAGGGTFTDNHIHHCEYTGIYVTEMADPQWSGVNRVELCGLCGVMVDVSARGMFTGMVITHCHVGVICFVGPATPFHMSYEEVGNADLLSAFATFENNRIVEHDLHGVLVLSVIAGCSLRVPLKQQVEQEAAGDEYFDPRLVAGGQVGPLMVAQNKNLCPLFKRNHIERNRMFGVYHDRFEFWDFAALSASRTGRTSISPKQGVKNAYGGYEILLGTSQVHHFEDHHTKRQMKQISFVENVICECAFGFGAGYGCHPFLLRNRIFKNYFFGVFLRFGSAVMADGCEVGENGLAGLYAANGAKGFIASGRIHANNALCRPLNSGNAVRDFNDAVFSRTFVTAEERAAMHMSSCSAAPATPSASTRRHSTGVAKAYAQVKSLGEVHDFVMADSVRLLGELVMASSDGMSLASGTAPSSLTHGVAGVVRRLSVGGGATLGGVEVEAYIRACTADGGIGVWVESGSRTTIKANTIEDHTHMGVFVSKGVLHHHRTLAKHFSIEMARLSEHKHDVFTGLLEPPPLASSQPGTLFTSHNVCATGVEAASQLLQSDRTLPTIEESFASVNMSMVLNTAELLPAPIRDEDTRDPRSDSIHFAHVLENTIRRNQYGVLVELHHVVRAIEGSSPTGAIAGAGKRPPLNPAALRANIASDTPVSSPSKQNSHEEGGTRNGGEHASGLLTPEDSAIMEGSHGADNAGQLDYVVVVEGNNVTDNVVTGILCEHIVEVHCGGFVASRGALNDCITEHYEAVRSRLLLHSGAGGGLSGGASVGAAAPGEVKSLLFPVARIPQKTQHAHLMKNTLSKNRKYQGEVLSRYVVVSADKARTLLQFDTLATPQSSQYCSQVLFAIPLFATLTQLPPPGVFLWEGNTVSDSRTGVHVVGYFGSRSVRFRNNVFVGIQEDALCVRGHLACATIGGANTFEQNGTAVHLLTIANAVAPTTPISGTGIGAAARSPADLSALTVQRDQRTRIFQNFFKGAAEQALRLDAADSGGDGRHRSAGGTLVYRNEFSDFKAGTTAAFISDRATSLLLCNVFRDSFCPVIVRGADEAGSLAATSRSSIAVPATAPSTAEPDAAVGSLLLCENKFAHNYIGVLACQGATPRLRRNLFEANTRSGLEIVGSFTRPVLTDCVFRNHVRDASGVPENETAATTSVLPPKQKTRAAADQGKVWLDGTTFSVTLVPENQHILSPNSTTRLPAGLVLAPMAEALVSQCVFDGNDIGVDAIRDALSSLVASSAQSARFETCLFQHHRVAGVLVRGTNVKEGAAGATTTGASAQQTGTAKSQLSERRVSAVPGANGTELPPETTTFSQCYFTHNTTDASFGDVITVERGFAVFRKCVFYGTVHGKADGAAMFVENFFPPRRDDSLSPTSTFSMATPPNAGPAFVLHERGSMRLENNRIFQRSKGGEALPAADGRVHSNLFVGCTVGVVVGPFCRTVFTNNRVLSSKDCGFIVYGGIVSDNEVFDAPTGVVVQDANAYKGINAIPTSIRTGGFDLSLTGNNLSYCGSDGCLIAGPGTFDGNYVSNCRNGFNAVFPASCDTKPPTVKRNLVFDNKVGIVLADHSVTNVVDNDVFDNEMTGVLVEGGAAGTLQSNRISSATEYGAMEQPNESRVKSLGNTIRNQFSPAFNRGVRSSRIKESEERERKLEAEVADQDDVVQGLFANEDALTAVCLRGMKELVALHAEPVTAVQNAYAGAPSRAMRRGSGSRAVLELADVVHIPYMEKSSGPSRLANPASSFRPQRAGSVSKSSLAARKSVMSVTKGEQKTTQSVLIHTFVSGDSAADVQRKGAAIGNSVATVLASASMSRLNLVTDITCTTAQLGAYLEATVPFLVIVVVDHACEGLNSIEQRALYALEQAVSAQESCLTCLLVPRAWAEGGGNSSHGTSAASSPFSSPRRGGAGGAGASMTLSAFATKHAPIEYNRSVDEVLDTLKTQISSAMKAQRRTSVSTGILVTSPRGGEGSDDDLDDKVNADAANDSKTARTPSAKTQPPTTFSREKVSQLMSLLTPEALGYGISSPTTGKKRKSVASISGADSSMGDDTKPKSTKKTAARASRGSAGSGSAGSKKSRPPSGKPKRTVPLKATSGSQPASLAPAGASSPRRKRKNSIPRSS